MATYGRVWDALSTSAAEADELQAKSEQLYALQQLIVAADWATPQVASRLDISHERAERLVGGDINEFTLAELRQLSIAAGMNASPDTNTP